MGGVEGAQCVGIKGITTALVGGTARLPRSVLSSRTQGHPLKCNQGHNQPNWLPVSGSHRLDKELGLQQEAPKGLGVCLKKVSENPKTGQGTPPCVSLKTWPWPAGWTGIHRRPRWWSHPLTGLSNPPADRHAQESPSPASAPLPVKWGGGVPLTQWGLPWVLAAHLLRSLPTLAMPSSAGCLAHIPHLTGGKDSSPQGGWDVDSGGPRSLQGHPPSWGPNSPQTSHCSPPGLCSGNLEGIFPHAGPGPGGGDTQVERREALPPGVGQAQTLLEPGSLGIRPTTPSSAPFKELHGGTSHSLETGA